MQRPFANLNAGFRRVFRPNALSVGLVVPIEAYAHGPVPSMEAHIARVQQAESLGFAAVWLRDVPFNVPSFGDAGQLYDPFVYLGLLAGQTKRIGLGVASIILPLRHPAHVAKAAASADALSEGRLLLGVASGDRPEEYPALGVSFADRGARFRASYEYIRGVGSPTRTDLSGNVFGEPLAGMEMLPRARSYPLLITGGSQQSPEWIADHGDGWMIYPRAPRLQETIVGAWRERHAHLPHDKPAMQPLYIDLLDDPDAPPSPIHLGLRLGVNALSRHLETLRAAGINHVALNLRFLRANVERTLERLATDLLPAFENPS